MSARAEAIRGRRIPAAELAGASMLAAAGMALLIVRPVLVSSSNRPFLALGLCYGAVGATGLAAPGCQVCVDLVSGPRKLIAMLAGLLAFGAVRFLLWPGGAMKVGLSAIALSMAAAIAEEAFFRRFLYGWLALRSGWLAVCGSALAFALIHVPAYSVAALPVDLGAGLLLSWQRWATDDWRVPAATHVAANLMVVIP